MSRATTKFNFIAPPAAQVSGHLASPRSGWLMKERFGAPIIAHVAFLALSILLWGWSYQQLTEEITVENRAALELVLSPDQRAEWAVIERPNERLSLSVSGPKERIDRFQTELAASRNRAIFELALPEGALDVSVDESRVRIEAPLEDFGQLTGVSIPDQVQVRFAEPESKVAFVLERMLVRPVTMEWSGVVHSPAWQLTAKLKQPLSARGPAGRMSLAASSDGGIVARVERFDLMAEMERLSVGADSVKRQEVFRSPRTLRLRLLPVSGIEFLSSGQGGVLEPTNEVDAEVSLSPSAQYQLVRLELDVDYLLPAWMQEVGARVEAIGSWKTVTVELLVSAAQARDAQVAGVRLVCDLTSLRASEGKVVADPRGIASESVVRIDAQSYPVRIEVADRSRFDYRLSDAARAAGRTDTNVSEVQIGFTWRATDGR